MAQILDERINTRALLGSLDNILQKDGFIIFIEGAKEKGKTDFALLLAEWCYTFGYKTRITSNIKAEGYMIENQITDKQTLETWLNEKGQKLFVFDELGKHLKRNRFMSSKNVEILDLCQLIRHYDAGLIGIAPSSIFIDSKFLNTDVLDAKVKKFTKKTAKINNYLSKETYFLNDVPRTSIKFDSKDIAMFTEKPKVELDKLPLCCRVALVYAMEGTYKRVLEEIPEISHPEQVRQKLIKCIKKHHS